jgi:hypothetical protein
MQFVISYQQYSTEFVEYLELNFERLFLAACLLILLAFLFPLAFRSPHPPGHLNFIVLITSAPKNREHWYTRECKKRRAMHSFNQSKLSMSSSSLTDIW